MRADAALFRAHAVGWVLVSGRSDKRVYFGGDTGCCSVPRAREAAHDDGEALRRCEVFAQIGARYGPMDLALIPIGAFLPRWFMSRVHLNPYDACFVHRAIRSKQSIGIHWGSFRMNGEDYDVPPRVLKDAKRKYHIADHEFIVVKHGASTRF